MGFLVGEQRRVSERLANVLVYDTIDDATVWGIAEGHLPRLIQQAEELLEDTDALQP